MDVKTEVEFRHESKHVHFGMSEPKLPQKISKRFRDPPIASKNRLYERDLIFVPL